MTAKLLFGVVLVLLLAGCAAPVYQPVVMHSKGCLLANDGSERICVNETDTPLVIDHGTYQTVLWSNGYGIVVP